MKTKLCSNQREQSPNPRRILQARKGVPLSDICNINPTLMNVFSCSFLTKSESSFALQVSTLMLLWFELIHMIWTMVIDYIHGGQLLRCAASCSHLQYQLRHSPWEQLVFQTSPLCLRMCAIVCQPVLWSSGGQTSILRASVMHFHWTGVAEFIEQTLERSTSQTVAGPCSSHTGAPLLSKINVCRGRDWPEPPLPFLGANMRRSSSRYEAP